MSFTFDDAYESTMANAPEILEEYSFRGAFYAVSSLVGDRSAWDGGASRPLATWDALRAAEARGHEIGNHTATHPHLDQLNPADQELEIESAHQRMVQAGLNPRTFCYPYGGLSDPSAVRYPVGLALAKRPATESDDRLRLPRIVVAYSDSIPKLLYKIYIRPKLP